MKNASCLFAIWLALACFIDAAEPAAHGIVIYCQPPNTYQFATEFAAFTKANHFSKLTKPNGQVEEIPTLGVISVINYPEITASESEADTAIAAIKPLLPQSSQREIQARLQVALSKWTNAKAFAIQKRKSESTSTPVTSPPVPQKSRLTVVVDGVTFDNAVLTAFDGSREF